jgi:mRNA-degrading endonuclease RelE of RelBE toxin-antitoxin system
MAAVRWHPKAEKVLELLDVPQARRIERAVDRLERFPLSGGPIEGVHPHLRRVLAGGGRTAWSIFYSYEPEDDRVTIVALGPPGIPVLPTL